MTELEQRLQLARGARYRCFGLDVDSKDFCLASASCELRDAVRGDVKTFYCPAHALRGATPIAENSPYLSVEVAGVLTLGASTLQTTDAKVRAVAQAEQLLAAHGMKLEVVGTRVGLMASRGLIISSPSRSDA